MQVHEPARLAVAVLSILVGLMTPANSVAAPASEVYSGVSPSVCTVVTDNKSMGTAFAIGSDGAFITNAHVLEGSASAKLYCGNREGRITRVTGFHKIYDLVRFEASIKNIPPILFAGESEASPGTEIFAIGSPLGLDLTISPGLISARPRQTDEGVLLQITAPISHGSSGGPIVLPDGRVLGVATSFLAEGQNLNFAVPIWLVSELMEGELSLKSYSAFLGRHSERTAPEPSNASPEPPSSPSDVSQLSVQGHALGSSCNELYKRPGVSAAASGLPGLGTPKRGIPWEHVEIGQASSSLYYICADEKLIAAIYLVKSPGSEIASLLEKKYGSSRWEAGCQDDRVEGIRLKKWVVAENSEILLIDLESLMAGPLISICDDVLDDVNALMRENGIKNWNLFGSILFYKDSKAVQQYLHSIKNRGVGGL